MCFEGYSCNFGTLIGHLPQSVPIWNSLSGFSCRLLSFFYSSKHNGTYKLRRSWCWIWFWRGLRLRCRMGIWRHAIKFFGAWRRWRLWGWFRPWMGFWHCIW